MNPAQKQEPPWREDPWNYSAWNHEPFPDDAQVCARCHFWENMLGASEDEHLESGLCRRWAPRSSEAYGRVHAEVAAQQVDQEVTSLNCETAWPETLNYDWCGEFEQRRGTPRSMPR
jgi:hypothetical protein